MGLGTDIDTGLPMSLSLNVYAKYQWQNYGAANENEWDGYRFKVKYFVPITELWAVILATLALPTSIGDPIWATMISPILMAIKRVLTTLSLPAIFWR